MALDSNVRDCWPYPLPEPEMGMVAGNREVLVPFVYALGMYQDAPGAD